jgi:CRISPR system Cascade subunit CasE
MYLSKVAIPKPELAKFATTRGLSRQLTTNYLVHSVMAEAFSGCPTPFEAQDKGRVLRVLFYTEADADALISKAQLGASPEAYEAIAWSETATKPMPDPFPGDVALRFELRACPVVRKASAGTGENAEGKARTWDEGDELDAFLARQWTANRELSREEVYCDWLARQFEERGGAEPQEVTMEGFSLAEMTRRTKEDDRSVNTFQRPDVTLSGTLHVTAPEAFADLLRSGIGRHKSFGYGLLKIRPA